MRWLNTLYVGDRALPRKEEIINKINAGKFQVGEYAICLSQNKRELLDIYPAFVFMQSWYRDSDILVVGLASGKEEAFNVASKIVLSCLEETGGYDIPKFITKKMMEDAYG